MKKSEIRKIVGAMDPRTGTRFVESLVGEGDLSAIRRMLESEADRLSKMQKFEKQVYENGFEPPAGIDEAGRGPLAGPVVAAAVILPEDYMLCGLNDSKKVSENRRETLSDIIKRDAVAYHIASADNKEIDREGILNCVKKIMLECVNALDPAPGYLLIDAVTIDTEIRQAGIVKGDSRSVSIAAASILAKVHRDSIMRKYDREYPAYGFLRNKGYGTNEHISALKKHGPVEIHRRSFIKNIV